MSKYTANHKTNTRTNYSSNVIKSKYKKEKVILTLIEPLALPTIGQYFTLQG